MERSEILEGNKMIAKFLGFFITPFNGSYHFACKYEKKPEQLNQSWEFRIEEAKYNSSWDWLMPVIEKISHIKIDWENSTDTDTYYPRTFGMLQNDTGLPMFRFNGCPLYVGATLIEATWIAVVEFTKTYKS